MPLPDTTNKRIVLTSHKDVTALFSEELPTVDGWRWAIVPGDSEPQVVRVRMEPDYGTRDDRGNPPVTSYKAAYYQAGSQMSRDARGTLFGPEVVL